ncbi:hypothetical protein [Ehrlichia muris]|nr:hypothetical protein [Ehrlichia muris]
MFISYFVAIINCIYTSEKCHSSNNINYFDAVFIEKFLSDFSD